jgi:hypothetical protein
MELLGVGIASSHHRTRAAMRIGLPEPQAVFAGQAIEPLASEALASESSSLLPSRLRQIGAPVRELCWKNSKPVMCYG